ncbi:MAG: LysR family transcriptional regulator [Eggerthellaceae bacterium]|nr:LysR family transcriptional regulator [Eggerthellaceae bacterium]
MDTAKCEALIKALEVGNLSGAAHELGYTPSGMSRLIASLEQELGFPLLVRSKMGVKPTTDCTRLMPIFSEMAALGRTLDETAAHIRGVDVGTVRVGTAYSQFYASLAQILTDFERQHPHVQVDISLANSTPLVRRLEAHEIDLCIISRREGTYEWTPLFDNELVALVSSDHPLADAKSFPIERFAEEQFVEVYPGQESDNSRTLAEHGIEPHVRFSVFDTQAAHELVAAGLGVTLMNRLYAREQPGRLIAKSLEPRTFVEIGVAMSATSQLSPAVKAFADFAIPRLKTS